MSRPPARTRMHVISDTEQLRAYRTPTRARVLNAILELGPCSVGEVADRLEWKAASLYYHVKALQKAGLVRFEGERDTGKKTEALYKAVAPAIVLDTQNRTLPYLEAVWDVYRAALRACERDLQQALFDESEGEGPRQNTQVHQITVRLDRRQAERLRKMLNEVVQMLAENEDREGTETVSLTTVVSRLPSK